jgi:hypothetical protein
VTTDKLFLLSVEVCLTLEKPSTMYGTQSIHVATVATSTASVDESEIADCLFLLFLLLQLKSDP